jgi:hypothetical protein
MRRPLPQSPLGRYPALSSTIFHLEEANWHHWPTSSDKRMNWCIVLHMVRGKPSTQSARNVTRDCTFSGASKSTTQKWDLVRRCRGEACTHIKQMTTNNCIYILCLQINIWDCVGAPQAASAQVSTSDI